jgi:hypothetical protein
MRAQGIRQKVTTKQWNFMERADVVVNGRLLDFLLGSTETTNPLSRLVQV